MDIRLWGWLVQGGWALTIWVVGKAEGGTTKCLNKRFSTDSRPLLHISPHQVPFKPHNELIQVIANEPIFAGLAIGIISSCSLLSSTWRSSFHLQSLLVFVLELKVRLFGGFSFTMALNFEDEVLLTRPFVTCADRFHKTSWFWVSLIKEAVKKSFFRNNF